MKKCSKCGELKPMSEFYKRSSSKDGLQYSCKSCNVNSVQHYRQDPEKAKAVARAHHLKKHGFLPEEFEELLEEIERKCQLCGVTMKVPCVDHDHKTLDVRGILCSHCNRGLGAFYDNPELLLKAVEYLKNPPLSHLEKTSKLFYKQPEQA